MRVRNEDNHVLALDTLIQCDINPYRYQLNFPGDLVPWVCYFELQKKPNYKSKQGCCKGVLLPWAQIHKSNPSTNYQPPSARLETQQVAYPCTHKDWSYHHSNLQKKSTRTKKSQHSSQQTPGECICEMKNIKKNNCSGTKETKTSLHHEKNDYQ